MFEIHNLRCVRPQGDARPFWAAELMDGTVRIAVDSRYGSWQAEVDGHRRGVLPGAAAQLQALVGRVEHPRGGRVTAV